MQSKKKDFEEEIEEIQKIFLIELYLAHCFFFSFLSKLPPSFYRRHHYFISTNHVK